MPPHLFQQLQAASQATVLMVKTVWDRSFELQRIPQLWSDVHNFLHHTPSGVHLQKPMMTSLALAGKPRTHHSRQVKSVRVIDLLAIVQLSFDAGVIQAAGRVFRQCRDTCIGNQTNPVLRRVPISGNESLHGKLSGTISSTKLRCLTVNVQMRLSADMWITD